MARGCECARARVCVRSRVCVGISVSARACVRVYKPCMVFSRVCVCECVRSGRCVRVCVYACAFAIHNNIIYTHILLVYIHKNICIRLCVCRDCVSRYNRRCLFSEIFRAFPVCPRLHHYCLPMILAVLWASAIGRDRSFPVPYPPSPWLPRSSDTVSATEDDYLVYSKCPSSRTYTSQQTRYT